MVTLRPVTLADMVREGKQLWGYCTGGPQEPQGQAADHPKPDAPDARPPQLPWARAQSRCAPARCARCLMERPVTS